jgi:phenylalanyl-tRNA synthetase alpha chain
MTTALASDLQALEADLLSRIEAAADAGALEAVRVAALGKSGEVTLRLRELGRMTPDERQVAGPALNGLRDRLATAIAARAQTLEAAALEARLVAERIDMTLDPPRTRFGTLHPVSQVMEEMTAIFADMDFAVAEGPDIEDDFHNFTALNFPKKHPARDMHDTFFFHERADGSHMLLRTHTSPVQIRTMLTTRPPIRIIAPGRTYRCDSDQTHTPMFHQIEGLVIDEQAHMGHLKGVLMRALAAFFEVDGVEVRFRPHHFPFTEPSAEMDVRCDRSGGQIRIGQGKDWLEILGCGMVHPNVLRACGLDPAVHQGFAFGMGIDRLAMLKYAIPDLRDMFAADARWTRHYGFQPFLVPSLAAGLS